jgi:acyl carrier protein
MTTILKKIQTQAEQQLKVDLSGMSLDTRLDSLGVDSLELIEFIFVLENEFQILLPDDRQTMQTIGELVGHIEAAIAKNCRQKD